MRHTAPARRAAKRRPPVWPMLGMLSLLVGLLLNSGARTATADTPVAAFLPSLPLELDSAALVGLVRSEAGLELGGDPLVHPGLADGAPAGLGTWPAVSVPPGASLASVTADSVGTLEMEARVSTDNNRWSGWRQASEPISIDSAAFIQVRALLAAGTQPPVLRGLELEWSAAGNGGGTQRAAQAPEQGPPTVRLWATRQGMVGGRTANGHRIAERDRFVALPSRRALAKIGGNEYQVRVNYNGRQATAPVWDVGPWNTKDNYWDPPAEREMFKELPRFVPEALAAWRDNFNGGRDQIGRWVTYPVAIDLADGTFWDDLGMRSSDWVDVTFLWLRAPSPPLEPSYPRVTRKPEPTSSAPPPPVVEPEPPPGQRWYFAEGSTRPPFDTWLLLQNPNERPVQATARFLLTDGSVRSYQATLAPRSRQSLFVNQILPDAEFSTRVDSDGPIFAERAMYFRGEGHVSTGAMAPSRQVCTAAGNTRDADTWLLVQNPQTREVPAVLSLYLEGGGIVRHALTLLPTSRQGVYTNLLTPAAVFGACLDADEGLIMERATYFPGGGGNAVLGSARLSTEWYFADGDTRPGWRTEIALVNPGSEPADVVLRYLPESGAARERTVRVPPAGSLTVDAGETIEVARFGVEIQSTKALVAERTMRFGPNGQGTSSSNGAVKPARAWSLAEGSTASPFQEELQIANPGSSPANVTVEMMAEAGVGDSRRYVVPGEARITVDVNTVWPGRALSLRVTAESPIVVERAMYWSEGASGTGTMGVPTDAP